MSVELQGVTRRYGDLTVFEDLTLALREGHTTVLMGPNGSGKTTVGRLVLGLDQPDAGVVAGVDRRRAAAVFQEDRLCQHLSARGNVRLVLPRDQWFVADLALERLGLSGAAMLKPVRELSGGQRRRVAIARALVTDAEVVVLDEPFTGIDETDKTQVVAYVRERLAGSTALVITHDVAEARALGATVVALEGLAS